MTWGLRYYYPGDYPTGFTRPHATELYGGIGSGPVFLKYSHADQPVRFQRQQEQFLHRPVGERAAEFLGPDVQRARGLPEGAARDGRVVYLDWKVGLTKDTGKGFSLAVAYIDTNANRSVYTNTSGRYVGRATARPSLTKTF